MSERQLFHLPAELMAVVCDSWEDPLRAGWNGQPSPFPPPSHSWHGMAATAPAACSAHTSHPLLACVVLTHMWILFLLLMLSNSLIPHGLAHPFLLKCSPLRGDTAARFVLSCFKDALCWLLNSLVNSWRNFCFIHEAVQQNACKEQTI